MENELMDNFKNILLHEMIPALGCTEPIAIALCSAKARAVLEEMPESAVVLCSGNIVKNVSGVIVPNSGGLKGIDIAASLGIFGGNEENGLQVLEGISKENIAKAKQFVENGNIQVKLVGAEENLYIRVILKKGSQSSEAEIKYDHTNFTEIMKNGVAFDKKNLYKQVAPIDKAALSIKKILEYATKVNFEENHDLKLILEAQIEFNSKISQEGLTRDYGASIGRTLMKIGDINNPATRSKAYSAAGSDARMGGCSLPVVINSGSGNQGLTVSLPVIEYAKFYQVTHDKLLRSLIVSNLTAIHQKKYIGKLSAFCGVVSASAAAGAGIGYLNDLSYDEISQIITNTITSIGGMVCDGAKPSCASKIAIALDNMIMSLELVKNNKGFKPGEGIVGIDVEKTIRNIGLMAHEGMKSTDEVILGIMLENQNKTQSSLK